MKKAEARELFRSKRRALSNKEKSRLDDLLLIQFQKLDLPFIERLLSYWPITENKEPDTHLFTDFMEFKNPGLIICYPKTDFQNHDMYAIQVKDGAEMIKNKYHIYEPAEGTIIEPQELDVIFVPLLGFDTTGFRIGYGKGFYDRYLARCRKNCLKIGFSYFNPVDKLEDTGEFDIPLNFCVTPAANYVF